MRSSSRTSSTWRTTSTDTIEAISSSTTYEARIRTRTLRTAGNGP